MVTIAVNLCCHCNLCLAIITDGETIASMIWSVLGSEVELPSTNQQLLEHESLVEITGNGSYCITEGLILISKLIYSIA